MGPFSMYFSQLYIYNWIYISYVYVGKNLTTSHRLVKNVITMYLINRNVKLT